MAGERTGSDLQMAQRPAAQLESAMMMPVAVTSVRAEIPTSRSHPDTQAPRAIVSMQSPRSAGHSSAKAVVGV